MIRNVLYIVVCRCPAIPLRAPVNVSRTVMLFIVASWSSSASLDQAIMRHYCRTLLFHCSSVQNVTFQILILAYVELVNIQEWHHFAAQVPFRPRDPQSSSFTENILQFDMLFLMHFCEYCSNS